jgi:hypothetical protein
MKIAHHCNALMGRRWVSSYIRVRMQSGAWQAAILRYPSSTNQTPDGFSPSSKEVFIQGITHEGKTFRPSDWAERLAGVMSSFRPGGAKPGSHLSYSPWCIPTTLNGVKCVVVNSDLRDHEPMAWDFVINFARDNNLQVAEACLLPDPPRGQK